MQFLLKGEFASGQHEEKRLRAILLLKSQHCSWMFQFHAADEKGTVTVTDREGYQKALAELIA